MLRVYEYRADKSGYRITKNAMYNVGQSEENVAPKKKKLNFIKKNKKKLSRKKSPFFRTSQKTKISRFTKSDKKESEIDNAIFPEENNLNILPALETTTQPVQRSRDKFSVFEIQHRKD